MGCAQGRVAVDSLSDASAAAESIQQSHHWQCANTPQPSGQASFSLSISYSVLSIGTNGDHSSFEEGGLALYIPSS
jgi:hypothetical protein